MKERSCNKKVKCDLCGTIISLINLNRHRNGKFCKKGGKAEEFKIPLLTSLDCPFCGKIGKSKNSAAQHLIRCKENPNRIDITLPKEGKKGKKGRNQFSKAKDLGLPLPEVSLETRMKLSVSGKNQQWDEKRRSEFSEVMRRIAKENPESYGSGNQGRSKIFEIDGLKLKGSWEFKFYLWCKSQKIIIERPINGFSYNWNGVRTYYPDFYLPEYNFYIEVKGYETERDKCKWDSFTESLSIIREKEIQLIEKNMFSIENIKQLIYKGGT